MKGIAKITLFKLDIASYKKELEKKLTEDLKAAIRAYLRAIIGNVIPVWSGASVATFLKLASTADTAINITPRVRSRISLGKSRSEAKMTSDFSKGVIKVEYSTSLAHLVFNEYNDAAIRGIYLTQPGPYQFQVKGAAAFSQVAATTRLPSPFKHLK